MKRVVTVACLALLFAGVASAARPRPAFPPAQTRLCEAVTKSPASECEGTPGTFEPELAGVGGTFVKTPAGFAVSLSYAIFANASFARETGMPVTYPEGLRHGPIPGVTDPSLVRVDGSTTEVSALVGTVGIDIVVLAAWSAQPPPPEIVFAEKLGRTTVDRIAAIERNLAKPTFQQQAVAKGWATQ
jgi:hypothetical protein